jgi:hypothetical protein
VEGSSRGKVVGATGWVTMGGAFGFDDQKVGIADKKSRVINKKFVGLGARNDKRSSRCSENTAQMTTGLAQRGL